MNAKENMLTITKNKVNFKIKWTNKLKLINKTKLYVNIPADWNWSGYYQEKQAMSHICHICPRKGICHALRMCLSATTVVGMAILQMFKSKDVICSEWCMTSSEESVCTHLRYRGNLQTEKNVFKCSFGGGGYFGYLQYHEWLDMWLSGVHCIP